MAEENINTLADKYQQLRNSSGDEEEKYTVLKVTFKGKYVKSVALNITLPKKQALGDQLGLPGTPAADILSKLGKPDELTPSLDQSPATIQTMPGKYFFLCKMK